MNRCLFTWLGIPLLSLCITSMSHGQTANNNQINAPKRAQPANSWQSFFALGNNAFKTGDYQTALAHFDRAQQLAGTQVHPTLVYNRAITFHKLRRYVEAINTFKTLFVIQQATPKEQQQWAELARYNLGLIAREQGKLDEARHQFNQLQQPGTNPRLQTLAERQLASMPAKAANVQPQAASKGSVLISMGITRDDNASSLADEISSQLSNAEDSYLHGLAYGHYYLNGNRSEGTKLYGLAQVRRYQEFESFDSQVSGFGLNHEYVTNDWGLEVGGRWLQSQLGNQHLSDQYSLLTRATRSLKTGQWELSYQSNYIDAAQTYNYIEGWQHQLRAAWQWRLGQVSITPALAWETNQREDKKTQQQFYSYSPDILNTSLALRWNINNQWQLYSQADWSDAEFADANTSRDFGGIEKEQKRNYERTQLLLGGRYRFAKYWYLKTEYSSTESDDNFQLYSYDKNLLSIKLDYGW